MVFVDVNVVEEVGEDVFVMVGVEVVVDYDVVEGFVIFGYVFGFDFDLVVVVVVELVVRVWVFEDEIF